VDPGIQFADLLAYNADETDHWKRWFREHPAALDLPCAVAGAGTVRKPLLHIFATELFFANHVLDQPKMDYENLPQGTLEELFAISVTAQGKFEKFLTTGPLEQRTEPVPLGFRDFKASKRKDADAGRDAQHPPSRTTRDLPPPAGLQARLDARLPVEQSNGIMESLGSLRVLDS
jgi:hypothetical protein